jgi:hypothetical protein
MGIERRAFRLLTAVERRVSLSTRKTVNQLASCQRLRDGIVRAGAGIAKVELRYWGAKPAGRPARWARRRISR